MTLLNRIRIWLLYKLWKPENKTPEQIEDYKHRGLVLKLNEATTVKARTACSHRKGGLITNVLSTAAIVKGLNNGHSAQYSVLKHQMMNGDIYVNCLRCGKKWKKPIRDSFKKEQDYLVALAEYKTAVNFPTNNTMSTSIQCRFSDDGETHRKLTENS